MTDTPTPPDGWYPDPAGGGGLRRWNGSSWTDEVRSATGEALATSGPQADVAGTETPSTVASGPEAGNGSGSAYDPASAHGAEHDGIATADASQGEAAAPSHGLTAQHDPAPVNEPAAHEPAAHEPAAHDTSHDPAASQYTPASPDSGAASALASESAAEPADNPLGTASSTPDGGYPGVDATPAASVPPVTPPTGSVTPPVAPVAPPAAPAYSSAPAFPGGPAYPSAPAATAAAGAAYAAAGAYQSAPPVAYDTTPRRDIKTNTVWVWLIVFLPVLSVLGVVMFDWSSYIRDSFYAGVYSYDSGSTPMAGTSAASTLITVVSTIVSLVTTALTVLFAFLDWRQLRARGVERPFHWAWSFFVLAIGSGLVYIIGRGVILRRRTGSGLAPIWASIAVNVAAIIALSIWVVVLLSQLFTLINEFSSTYGY